MGIASWLVAGLFAFALGRAVLPGRNRLWKGELVLALVTGLLLGILATTLDFGGWQELEWRASLFAFLGAAAAVGVMRLLRA